jgi:hypothetical protein
MENCKKSFFDRSDGGQDNLRDPDIRQRSAIWTLATRRNNSHVNCMSASQVFCFEQMLRNDTKPFFSLLKQNKNFQKKTGSIKVFRVDLISNDDLIVLPYFETMELWHV